MAVKLWFVFLGLMDRYRQKPLDQRFVFALEVVLQRVFLDPDLASFADELRQVAGDYLASLQG
jgi:hypothetical protein